MKNNFKKISIIISIIVIILSIPFYSNADESGSLNMTDIMNGGDTFVNKSNNEGLLSTENETNAINTIYYIGLTLGVVIAIAVGMILGIQFITSGVEGQAKIKEKLIPYAVGCIVVFGAFGIWRLVYNLLNAGFSD